MTQIIPTRASAPSAPSPQSSDMIGAAVPHKPAILAKTVDEEPDAARAQSILPGAAFDYYAGSAGDERTYTANLEAFRAIHFRPHVLRSVPSVDISTTLPSIGPLSMPVLIAPMAMQRLAHPCGECGIARAAHAAGVPYVLSTFATTDVVDVAAVHPRPLMQLYVLRDRAATSAILRAARAVDAAAVVVTVDAPVLGRRARQATRVFDSVASMTHAAGQAREGNGVGVGSTGRFDMAVSPELDERRLREVVQEAGVPVWVKGVLRADDAVRAVQAGAAAVVVSNHGGRQLEGAVPSMWALPEVVSAVGGRVPVLVDSGVRSGEDVVRALALGAKAVMVGRPVLWAAAAEGEAGVSKLLRRMADEVEWAMALCGVNNVREIKRDLVVVDGGGANSRCKL